jgi:apolipoprotein N-acyltransferase
VLDELESSGIAKLIRESKVPYLIGSPRYEDTTGDLYNSALWFDPKGELQGSYDKRVLVPFGEYIPFGNLLFFLKKIAYSMGVGDFEPGANWQVFQGPMDFKFASLVCFENLFPSMTSRFVKEGAEFFVVITNDAWFQKSRAPYEHLYTSIFRAIETRRPFVHAANTGISGYIDADGRLVDTLRDKNGRELFVTGGMTRPVYPQKGITFYVRWGGFVPWVAFLVFLISFGFVTLFKIPNKK